jgi:phosphate transport system substrate-binding protein
MKRLMLRSRVFAGFNRSKTLTLAVAVFGAAALPAAAFEKATPGHPVKSEGSLEFRGQKSYYPADAFDLSDLPPYVPQARVSGVVRIWGSNYIHDGRTSRFWEAGFKKFQPDVTFAYTVPNSLYEVVAVAAGVADIGVGPRLIYNDFSAFNSLYNYGPTEILFATGACDAPGWNPAFAIFVNAANPITKLTIAQLDGIYGAARAGGWDLKTWHPEYGRGPGENIRTWGQAGATGDWADKPIHPLGLNMRAHWATSISDFLLKGSDQWNENLHMYPGNIYYDDGTVLSGAEAMVYEVVKDPLAICYSTIFFKKPGAKALPLAGRDGGTYYALNLENVRDRTYPLTDSIYMYLNKAPGKPVDPKVREFLRYILSREGQQDIARDGKYLPLKADLLNEQLKKLD